MTDIMKLARIELIIIPIFIFFKAIRPRVLDSAAPEIFKITLLSLPNFFEAVIGTLTLTGVGLFINDRLSQAQQLKPKLIYIVAVVLAACYVISQELNLISLRANGTTDPFDVLFSIVGLVVGYCIILFIKPKVGS